MDMLTPGLPTVEDIVEFNDQNTGTEGANEGNVPAFPSGQVRLHQTKVSFTI